MDAMNFAAGLVIRDRYTRAAKGGTTIGGKFYRGGQFCPAALPDDLASLLAPEVSPRITRQTIAGFVYAVAPAPWGLDLHRIDTNHTYSVRAEAGRVTCTCPDYAHRKAGTSALCKHGKAMVDAGVIKAPTPAVLVPFALRVADTPAPVATPRRARFVPSADDFADAARLFG